MAFGVVGDLARSAFGDYPATLLATFGAEVDNVVGNLDDIEVVFDNNNRISLVNQLVKHLDKATNILEMESRGRLVENIERTARFTLREFCREFYTLALTTRQSCARLAEREISQTHILNSLQLLVNGRNRLEEIDCDVYSHIEYIIDTLAFIADFESLLVVAIAAARLALDIDIGQEIHLDGLHSCATTLLATTTLDIERETASLETSHLCIGRSLKELADIAKNIRVCCRI